MKHAYLIMANRNPRQLQMLIDMLDDYRNDIFLMIDKKSTEFHRDFKTKYSKIHILDSIDIYWGTYSQVDAEIRLFKAAKSNGNYEYYHLMSGLDLPLFNQDYIHNFFDNHPNKEFIKYTEVLDLNLMEIFKIKIRDFIKNFGSETKTKFLNKNKVRRILEVRVKPQFFKNKQKSNNLFVKLLISVERNFLLFIPQFKIDRNKITTGSQWVSIDDDLVRLILKEESNIKKIYSSGVLSDEIFIPTLLNCYPEMKKKVFDLSNSHFEKNKLQGNLRYINWWDVHESAGSPYVWRQKDASSLMKARDKGHLFARKFDYKIDKEIIELIYRKVLDN